MIDVTLHDFFPLIQKLLRSVTKAPCGINLSKKKADIVNTSAVTSKATEKHSYQDSTERFEEFIININWFIV